MKNSFNKQLKRTKTAVTFFAKTRKKAAINFGPLAGRYVAQEALSTLEIKLGRSSSG